MLCPIGRTRCRDVQNRRCKSNEQTWGIDAVQAGGLSSFFPPPFHNSCATLATPRRLKLRSTSSLIIKPTRQVIAFVTSASVVRGNMQSLRMNGFGVTRSLRIQFQHFLRSAAHKVRSARTKSGNDVTLPLTDVQPCPRFETGLPSLILWDSWWTSMFTPKKNIVYFNVQAAHSVEAENRSEVPR
eukprot:Selendium_serpulae@DN2169_c0_g1_i1.p2